MAGVARNLSLGGMFVEGSEPVAVSTPALITCVLSPGDRPMSFPCTVRWTTASGFGVQLGLLGARETHAVADLMRAAVAGAATSPCADALHHHPKAEQETLLRVGLYEFTSCARG